jgi:type IV secretory pathway VirB2 component (pilin)
MALTPLQLNSAAGLLQNQGLAPNAEFISAVAAYNNTVLISPLLTTIEHSTGNISANTISQLETLAANSCASLSDSVPAGYTTLTVSTNPAGFTGRLTTTANTYMGNGDLSKFCQTLSISQGYAEQTNIFVNSAVNSQTYLGNTFTDINSMITGGITNVNLVTNAFGTDLIKLGRLINLKDLGNFGSPLALVQQLYSLTGVLPVLSVAFIAAGVSQDVVLNLTNPLATVADSAQRLMYQAMTTITGNNLTQILTVLGVTTAGITTMADLLNPLKLFPNSYQSLTAPTEHGPVAIYIDTSGSVNNNLIRQLPPYVVSSLV